MQIKEADLLPAEEQLKATVLPGWPKGDAQSAKGLAYVVEFALKFDLPFGSD
jgi:hypothetical protein